MNRLTQDLCAVVGRDGVLTEPDELLVYECDGLPQHKARPHAVVFPRSTEEVAEVVKVLNCASVPCVPRGAGTGLSGGAVALEDGVIIELARMRRLLYLDAENLTARVECGIVNQHVSRAAAPFRLHYVPDPSSNPTCTVGGNIAENAGGIHCLKYGVTVDHVLAARVVLSDGEVVDLRDMENGTAGYDLLGVFIGSEGTFGIATEATLRLTPLPPAVRTLLADFADTATASHAVSAIIANGFVPAALEMMDGRTVRAIEASVFAVGLPPDAEAVLLIELDGLEAGLDEEAERCAELCRTHGARGVRLAQNERERKKLWAARKGAFGAMGRIAPDLMLQDAVVPRSRLPEVLAATYRIGAQYDLAVANVFHAGDGNLHPFICFDSRDAAQVKRVKEAGREIMEACVRAGGTITGEHGVGLDKSEYLPLIFSETDLDVMVALRRAFDPAGLCNPGKIIPVRRGCGEGRRFNSSIEFSDSDFPHQQTQNVREGDGVAIGAAGGAAAALSSVRADVPSNNLERFDGLARIVGDEYIEQEDASGVVTVAPSCAEEVCEALGLAAKQGWTISPQGNGTWCDTGKSSRSCDVRLSTNRMRRIVEHEPADMVVTAEAGMTLAELNAQLATANQWLPLDPPDDGLATLGGILATNTTGAQALGYGAPRNLCTGMRVALSGGRRLRAGGRVVKNVAGYDLPKLFTGSYGTLGVILEATFKLRPLPQRTQTVAAYGSLSQLLRAARRISTAPLFPVALELVSPLLAASIDAPHNRDAPTLLVRFAGAETTVAAQTTSAHDILRNEGAIVLPPSDTAIWRCLAAAPLRHTDKLIWRVQMPPASLAAWLTEWAESSDSSEMLWQAGLGDGRFRAMQPAFVATEKNIASFNIWRAQAHEREGNLIIENASSEVKDAFGTCTEAGGAIALLMRRVKSALDPLNLLRPDCFVAGI